MKKVLLMGVDNITGITVCWNLKDLMERSIGSIRKFHPTMKILVVDGSDVDNECCSYLDNLVEVDDNLKVIHTGYNIGHGRGMNLGIKYVNTDYVLFFDSDIIMVKSPLQQMVNMMEEDTYGVGYSEIVAPDGHDFGVLPSHKSDTEKIKYLHPMFQLIQVKEYNKFKPYIHHGAPCISAMVDIHKKGLSEKILKDFPGLGHVGRNGVSWKACKGEWVIHDVSNFGGTGRYRVLNKMPHIEGEWDRDYLK
jgi:glycosyltransferase involved in cell wall biosynthesis